MKGKKASLTLYFALIVSIIIIILIAAVFAPMGVLFNAEMYAAGEDIMLQANESIQNIDNNTVRLAIEGVVGTAYAAAQNNIEVNANIFQYSWILVIVLTSLIVFLYARRLSEVQTGRIV